MNDRAAQLVQAFEHVERTRMAGVPVLNRALVVEAVGFAPQRDAAGEVGVLGVLVTPWFMNLIWLPADAADRAHAVGATRLHVLGGERFEFIGAHEPQVGAYSLCSLFSPMFEFADQAAARATAQAVLDALRAPLAAAASGTAPARASGIPSTQGTGIAPAHGAQAERERAAAIATTIATAPARRSFLFGRSTAA